MSGEKRKQHVAAQMSGLRLRLEAVAREMKK